VIAGWHWRLDDIDKDAISGIKSTTIKQQFIESLADIYEDKDFRGLC
jgi:hypothetical protein